MALGGPLEAAERLGIQLEYVGLGRVEDPGLHGPVLIGHVPRFVVLRRFRDVLHAKAAILDIAVQLRLVGGAAPVGEPMLAHAPAGQRADAWLALVMDDVIGVVGEFLAAILGDEARQVQARTQLAQGRLEAAHVAVRLDHGPADRVGGGVRLAYGTVEQRDAVVALQIGRVGQDEVGIGHHLAAIGVRIDDARDDIVAARVLVRQHVHHARRIHRRIPCHVRHIEEKRVDPVGIACMGVGDDHVHKAMRTQRIFPRKRLVDARGAAVGPEAQILGACGIAQMRAIQRLARRAIAVRPGVDMRRLGVWRLETHAAWHLDRAEQDLKDVQRAAGLEPVGMGRDAAHGVKADRAARHCVVSLAAKIGPRPVQCERLFEGDARQFGGNGADLLRGDAAAVGDGLGGVFGAEIPLRQQMHHRAVRDARRTVGGVQIGADALGVKRGQLAGIAVDHLRLAVRIAQEKAEFRRFGIAVHQNRCVGVARQIRDVDAARLHQFMHEGEDKETVGAGRDPDPVIGHGVIAGADGIDPDHARAARLDAADAHLDRVAVMIFGHAEQHEKLGMIPIGGAEFPECPAHRIDARRRHVDRAKAAMRRVVRRAEVLRPIAGKALRLIASGEERQLLGRLGPQRGQPIGRQRQRLVPADFLELARSARSGPAQRGAQAGGGIVLHDPGAALGTQDALVDRVIAVALDIGDLALLHMHVNAAAARAHVAGRLADLVRHGRAEIEIGLAVRHWDDWPFVGPLARHPNHKILSGGARLGPYFSNSD